MSASPFRSSRGFTLLQLLVTMGIMAVLMGMLLSGLRSAQRSAVARGCAGNLKVLAMDLERYRVENRGYPAALKDLYPNYVKSENALRCPADPQAGRSTYSDFYVLRDPQDQGKERLVLACPLHQESGRGVEVFLAGTHERGQTLVGEVTSVSGDVRILEHDAKRTDAAFWANATTATLHTEVGPGDWIRVASGNATVTFKDNSRAEITPLDGDPTEVMVIDAFRTAVTNPGQLPFYTVLRLARGTLYNIVTPGSKYEIVTPTGTAGARGTEFRVTYEEFVPAGRGQDARPVRRMVTEVHQGKVRVSGRRKGVEISNGRGATVEEDGNAHENHGHGGGRDR